MTLDSVHLFPGNLGGGFDIIRNNSYVNLVLSLQRGLILSTAVSVIPQPSPFCTLVTAILPPRKMMSFSRLPRLTSAVRTLHTSCPARQPAANPTEIFQKAFGERAAAQTSPLMKNEVQDNREQFKANQVRLYPFPPFFSFSPRW